MAKGEQATHNEWVNCPLIRAVEFVTHVAER